MTDAELETETAPFVAAILADPADDLPRLVFADFLDETGEAEYGEFIRAQVEIARMEKAGEPCEIDPHEGHTCCEHPCPVCVSIEKYDALRRREADLFQAHYADWWPGDLSRTVCLTPPNERETHAGGTWHIVRRGFVAEVRTPLASLFGEPCPVLESERNVAAGRPFTHFANCPACSGSGRTPGAAPGLFGSRPIESVVLSDREPGSNEFGGPIVSWYSGREDDEPRACVPYGLIKAMYELRGEDDDGRTWINYPTRELALSALSRACVALGRSLAAGCTHEAGCGACRDGVVGPRPRGVPRGARPMVPVQTEPYPCPACEGTGKVTRPGLPPLPPLPRA